MGQGKIRGDVNPFDDTTILGRADRATQTLNDKEE